MTLQVMVPVLRNTVWLREGEKLYLEVVKAKSEKRKAETWKSDATKAKVKKPDGPQSKAPGKGTGGRRSGGDLEVGTSVDI